MGCKGKASLPYGYGNVVPVYLWKSIKELYHKLPFIPILIFSFLALHKTCKATRKAFSIRDSKNLPANLFQTLDHQKACNYFPTWTQV